MGETAPHWTAHTEQMTDNMAEWLDRLTEWLAPVATTGDPGTQDWLSSGLVAESVDQR